MLKLFKRFGWFKPTLTQDNLAQYAQQVSSICKTLEQQNLAIVDDSIESTSGYNNDQLVIPFLLNI